MYFPWLQTKVAIPDKQFAKGHEDLVAWLDELDLICKQVVKKQGIDCYSEVLDLQKKMHVFVADMNGTLPKLCLLENRAKYCTQIDVAFLADVMLVSRSWISYHVPLEHLMEEERDIPPLARKHFTEDEERKLVEKIGRQEANLKLLRKVFPAVMESFNTWGTRELRDDFEKKFPGLLRHLATKYWYPDYETSVRPKRDAPFLDTEPLLTRVGCCGFSFCFPCIL